VMMSCIAIASFPSSSSVAAPSNQRTEHVAATDERGSFPFAYIRVQ
jgi:hypothetical protein